MELTRDDTSSVSSVPCPTSDAQHVRGAACQKMLRNLAHSSVSKSMGSDGSFALLTDTIAHAGRSTNAILACFMQMADPGGEATT